MSYFRITSSNVGRLLIISLLAAPESETRSSGMSPFRNTDSDELYRMRIFVLDCQVIGVSDTTASESSVGTMTHMATIHFRLKILAQRSWMEKSCSPSTERSTNRLRVIRSG
jgi:hypothetical protein